MFMNYMQAYGRQAGKASDLPVKTHSFFFNNNNYFQRKQVKFKKHLLLSY